MTATAPLRVRYANAAAASAMVALGAAILGVAGFGARRPDFLPVSCPFVATPITPAAGGPMFEIWQVAGPCRPARLGPVEGALNDDFAFGAVAIEDAAGVAFEQAVETAYLRIFDFLDQTGLTAPIRFWNYLTAITAAEDGLERYRRFNIARHKAFAARLRQQLPPAASALGGACGTSVIYFLAARAAARTIENPRQISAYDYPPLHGPRSPSFSRASLHELGSDAQFFISGTASIKGHRTRHIGDPHGQIAETIENLRTLMQAVPGENTRPTDPWMFKAYLSDAKDRDMIDQALATAFGADHRCLYLRADICRPALLLEIEAFRPFETGPALA